MTILRVLPLAGQQIARQQKKERKGGKEKKKRRKGEEVFNPSLCWSSTREHQIIREGRKGKKFPLRSSSHCPSIVVGK